MSASESTGKPIASSTTEQLQGWRPHQKRFWRLCDIVARRLSKGRRNGEGNSGGVGRRHRRIGRCRDRPARVERGLARNSSCLRRNVSSLTKALDKYWAGWASRDSADLEAGPWASVQSDDGVVTRDQTARNPRSIRGWATENGIAVPARGRIPRGRGAAVQRSQQALVTTSVTNASMLERVCRARRARPPPHRADGYGHRRPSVGGATPRLLQGSASERWRRTLRTPTV